MNEFTTPVDATITEWQPNPSEYRAALAERDRLASELDSVRVSYQNLLTDVRELRQKIENVKGYMRDIYSEDGEIDDRVKEIAEYLGIELTKRISGDASFTISWSAEVPIDFDASDFEISFDVDCDTYEADNFDWQEENTEVNGEDE